LPAYGLSKLVTDSSVWKIHRQRWILSGPGKPTVGIPDLCSRTCGLGHFDDRVLPDQFVSDRIKVFVNVIGLKEYIDQAITRVSDRAIFCKFDLAEDDDRPDNQ